MSTRSAAHSAHERGLAVYLAAVRDYIERGWPVVLLAPLRKGPSQEGWQKQRHCVEGVRGWARHYAFDQPATTPNLGLLLGAPSGGLVDVDCDCAEARAAAPYVLPATGRVFGRASSPASHSLYVVTDKAPKTAKFAWAEGTRFNTEETKATKEHGEEETEEIAETAETDSPPLTSVHSVSSVLNPRPPSHGAMLVELRSTGCQTVVPPSLHPSTERVRWEEGKQGEPGRVTANELHRAVAKLAAATLLAKHWPAVGQRDEAAMAVAGMLLRAGWSEEETDTFCEAVAVAARDEEAPKRRKAAGTAQRLAAGETAWGARALAQRLSGDGEPVLAQARQWLGMKAEREMVTGTGYHSVHACPPPSMRAFTHERASMGNEGTHGESHDTDQPDIHIEGRGVLAAEVTAEPVRWLWQGRIPFGTLTLLDGDPGLGKSLVTLDLAARVSRGWAMPASPDSPDGTPRSAGGVVLLSAEDVLAATIRPRLDAAGADLERVYILQTVEVRDRKEGKPYERAICLPLDEAVLEAAMARVAAKLVVIDPLMAYLDVKVNSWRDQDVRGALAPLGRLAERTGAAFLILRHLTKGGGSNAIYRGGGSIGIIGAARSGLLVAKSPDDPEHERILASSKSNLGPPMPALRYRLQSLDEQQVRVEWLGTSQYTASALLSQAAEQPTETTTAGAMEWLREMLGDGEWHMRAEIERAGRGLGYAGKPLRNARERLGVRMRRDGFGPGAISFWQLPTAAPTPESAEPAEREVNIITRQEPGISPYVPSPSIHALPHEKARMGTEGTHDEGGEREQGHEEAAG